jgi:predicted small metal-binding protein
MPEIRCADAGAFTCRAHFKAETMDDLLRRVAEHLRVRHDVKQPTQAFLNYYAKVAAK